MQSLRNMLLVLSVILLTGCCMRGNTKQPLNAHSTFVNTLEDSTVALVITDSDGDNLPYCAGVWIDNTTILTANHCVQRKDDDDQITSEPVIGSLVKYVTKIDVGNVSPYKWPKTIKFGLVAASDATNDLAVIYVDPRTVTNHSSATLKLEEEIADGDDVHIVGHTVGYWWTYIHGTVSSTWSEVLSPNKSKVKALQISAPVMVGNSGGPVFNAEGRLIGICSWITTRGPNISFFIHHDVVVKFLMAQRI